MHGRGWRAGSEKGKRKKDDKSIQGGQGPNLEG